MSAATFDNLVISLRADYVGQPRDAHGKFASNKGGFVRSPAAETPSSEETTTRSRAANIGKKVLGGAASIGVGIGAGLVAATIYEQLKPMEPVKGGDDGEAAPQPQDAPPTKGAEGAPGPRKSQEERLKDIVEHLSRQKPAEKGGGNAQTRKLEETLKEYREKTAKKYQKPRKTEDAFQAVVDYLRIDWDESKHPRDKTGRFAAKGSGRGGGSPLLSSAAPSSTGAGGKPAKTPDDGFDGLNIRDLKKLAREHHVSGYSNMKKEELIQGIRAVKSDPKQQQRIKETIRRKQEAKKIVGNTPAAKLARDWERMNKLVKASGVNPRIASLALGAFVVGVGHKEWERQRSQYQSHIGDSAEAAATRSRTIPTKDYSDKPNLVFAVGGYKGMGSTGKAIIDEFTRDGNEESEWFKENANFVAVENNEYDVKPLMPKRLPGGMINPAYLAESMMRSGGNLVTQRFRKRNEQAVELAAQIYSQVNARGGQTGTKRVNADIPITIVTHGDGGRTVDEALAILRSGKMHLSDSEKGTAFLDQIQVVKLGSSSMGLVDPPSRDRKPLSMRTFTSSNDPFSALPKKNEVWKSDVPGGDVKDYMRTSSIRDELLNTMGYDGSTYQSKKTAADVTKKTEKRTQNFQDLKNKKASTPPPPPPEDGGAAGASPSTPNPPPTPTPTPTNPPSIPQPSTEAAAARDSQSRANAKSEAKDKGRVGVPTKEGHSWVKKEGHPDGGYFRKLPKNRKKSDSFDLVVSHLLEV